MSEDIEFIVDLAGVEKVKELKHDERVENHREVSWRCKGVKRMFLTIIIRLTWVGTTAATVDVDLSAVTIFISFDKLNGGGICRIVEVICIFRDKVFSSKCDCANHCKLKYRLEDYMFQHSPWDDVVSSSMRRAH